MFAFFESKIANNLKLIGILKFPNFKNLDFSSIICLKALELSDMVLFVAGCFFNINIQWYFCDWLTRKRRAYANSQQKLVS